MMFVIADKWRIKHPLKLKLTWTHYALYLALLDYQIKKWIELKYVKDIKLDMLKKCLYFLSY